MLKKIKELSHIYQQGMPGWTLIQNAWGHINSVHYLEAETSIGEETLGVKFRNE